MTLLIVTKVRVLSYFTRGAESESHKNEDSVSLALTEIRLKYLGNNMGLLFFFKKS